MTQSEINSSIETALCGLSDLSAQVFDYWYAQLFDEDENMIEEEWSVETLKLMEDDVMSLTIFDQDDDTM